jgi:AmmeMemoRadiSam system protein A
MEPDKLTKEEKLNLIKLARKTIEQELFETSDIEVNTDFPIFHEKRAAFVTLHKNGALKGCIGHIIAQDTLINTVKEMAYSAAFKDPRFSSLTQDEYPYIDVEISVLTPTEKIKSWKDVKPGVHGIIISKGYYKGVLLPQVATEHNWDSETFVKHGCMKAGLPPDEYKRGVDIEIFAANVFNEKQIQS